MSADHGVINPAKMTGTALQDSASVSALMLTTEAVICEILEKKAAPMPGGGHGPGDGLLKHWFL
ncbi:MAG TPA: hypothetical protein VGK29_20250 [Paludibaculum sp.]